MVIAYFLWKFLVEIALFRFCGGFYEARMGDGQSDYSSSESMGSDKYFNILSTILEECNEDATVEDIGSSSDPSDANKTSDSGDKKQSKGNKTKKKVAFVLPTKKDNDWMLESQYRGDDTEFQKDATTSEGENMEVHLSNSFKNLKSRNTHSDDCKWGKIKTVFDILEMPELSGIFKGFESDCCTNKCQDMTLKHKEMGNEKKKKSSKKGKRSKIKSKQVKKEIKDDRTHEFKCDHSKLMRNEDGTRIEVDHHFRNSNNPVLINWLDKKNKEEKKKRREERKLKKEERKEKKMQALALVEKKHLSETLVKDWMRKKRKELQKRFASRKVEPDGASHASSDLKANEEPLGYTVVETFSSEGPSSSSPSTGPPSRIGASDSGLSTNSTTSLHNNFNSTLSTSQSASNKNDKMKKKSKKSKPFVYRTEISLHSNSSSKHRGHKSEDRPEGREHPDLLGLTRMSNKVSEELNVQKNLQKHISAISVNTNSDLLKTENEKQHKKSRRKRRPKVNPDKLEEKDEVTLRVHVSGQEEISNTNKKDDNDLETDIILKEVRRPVEEKMSRKKRVSSWNREEEKPVRKHEDRTAKYHWKERPKSGKSLGQTAVVKQMTLNQRPEPQGSDDLHSSKESVNEILKTPPQDTGNGSEIADDESNDQSENLNYLSFKDNIVPAQDSETDKVVSDDISSTPTFTEIKPQKIVHHIKNSDREKSSKSLKTKTEPKSNKTSSSETVKPDTVNLSVKEDEFQGRKVVSPIRKKTNKEFDDCLDFFLEDYHRPWMEL